MEGVSFSSYPDEHQSAEKRKSGSLVGSDLLRSVFFFNWSILFYVNDTSLKSKSNNENKANKKTLENGKII